MRLTLRQIANVALVAAVGFVALAWAVIGLADLDPRKDTASVTVMAPSASGALPGAEVTYLGVPAGRVSDTENVGKGVRIELELEPPGPMARELRADIRQKTALGEPYVDLSPAGADTPEGDPDGTTIPADRVTTPRALDTLLVSADKFLAELHPDTLARFMEGSAGIVGHEAELKSFLADAADISTTLSARRTEIGTLTQSAAELASTLDEHRGSLDRAITGFDRLGTVLADRTDELSALLTKGADFSEAGSGLVSDIRPDVHGIFEGLDTFFSNLSDNPKRLGETLDLAPLFITRFGSTFEGGYFWLSAGGGFPFVPGTLPRLGVPVYGTGLRIDRIFLPSIAQRIRVDLGGEPQAIIPLLSPEDTNAVLTDPAAASAIQKREAAAAGVTLPQG